MKTIACAALLLALAACATPGTNTNVASAQPAVGKASYCWKDRLVTDGDNLVCNWASSTREACENMALSTVRKSALAAGPDRGTMCANGQWLVMVTAK